MKFKFWCHGVGERSKSDSGWSVRTFVFGRQGDQQWILVVACLGPHCHPSFDQERVAPRR